MKVNCRHFLAAYRAELVDAKDESDRVREWFVDCDLFGNDVQLCYECGKGRCEAYSPADNRKGAGK